MKTDDTVTVSGAAGTVTALVLDVRDCRELPDLPVLESIPAREILNEGFKRVAVISHLHGPEPIQVMFVALQDHSGTWWDLKGQQLSITVVPVAAEATA